MDVSEEMLSEYLSNIYHGQAKIHGMHKLGHPEQCDLKGFGYGVPYVIEFTVDGAEKRVVLESMHSEGFGHENFSDRARILLWQHSVFGKLPRHVRSVDVGAFSSDGSKLKSLGDYVEFFLLTEFVDGQLYHIDLDKLMATEKLRELDRQRCLALADYLAEIHDVKLEAPQLYVRRARELIGDGECMMGLLDSFPTELDFTRETFLIDIERDCVVWRWRLKRKADRLSQVHGDFHPWNILFRQGTDFTVLDRSRGEWGEPADDVAALTINYLFYSLQKYGKLQGVFEELFTLFWDSYLQKTADVEIFDTIQPFYAWRGLVVASPVWYPTLEKSVRVKLLNFVKIVLNTDKFDVQSVNDYIIDS